MILGLHWAWGTEIHAEILALPSADQALQLPIRHLYSPRTRAPAREPGRAQTARARTSAR